MHARLLRVCICNCIRKRRSLFLTQLLGEMRETVPKEFDFLREARLMRLIAARIKSARLPGVVVPEPLLALSSPQLLVMQRMPGARLSSCLNFNKSW